MGNARASLRPIFAQLGAAGRKTAAQVAMESNVRLDGQVALITGANTGIGKETAKVLASIGARVIITCRDDAKCQTTKAELKNELAAENIDDVKIETLPLELASLDSCRTAAQHVLGVFMGERQETVDGLELHIGVNHFGHFLFGTSLTPLVRKTAAKYGAARIVILSSDGHRAGNIKMDDYNWARRAKNFDGMRAYMDSKQANVLYATELNRRLTGSGVIVSAVHPGVVKTDLSRGSKLIAASMKMMGPMLKTVEQGAATTVYAAISPDLRNSPGAEYFANCRSEPAESTATDPQLAQQLWAESERVTGFTWPSETDSKGVREKTSRKKKAKTQV